MMHWRNLLASLWVIAGALVVFGCAPDEIETAKTIGGELPAAPTVGTFSIVAVDRETGEIGVAVQSRIVAVGAVVPYAEAGVGAVATQAAANPHYGPFGLALLHKLTPQETIEVMVANDPGGSHRQVGIVSADGQAHAYTGDGCMNWAGHIVGDGYTVQGNILESEEVVSAMAEAFEASAGEVLPERLLRALEAGQEAGGDRRGRQSAGLLVARKGWGYGGGNDRFRDLRVDEHETPIAELRRVYDKHRKLFPRPE
jgi:uncharacterized Ntn-hydrolase superfamily protein